MKLLRMKRPWAGVNAGETAGWPDVTADMLIEKGYGKFIRELPDSKRERAEALKAEPVKEPESPKETELDAGASEGKAGSGAPGAGTVRKPAAKKAGEATA